jgi:predicted nucleic acid-binding protein
VIILDTNVISEAFRPVPNGTVIGWVRKQPEDSLFLTIITVAELFAGIELMPDGRRRRDLAEAIEETIRVEFSGRILPFDLAAARAFGTIRAERQLRGRGAQVSDL